MYRTFKWTRSSQFRNDLTRAYEPIQPLLLSVLAERTKCDLFVDVGANIGAYSVLMTAVESIREIHAFEPTPETYDELVRNIEINGLSGKITAHRKAISDSAKRVSFGIVNRLSGANSILSTSIHSQFEKEVEVEAVRFDDYLPLTNRRVCMKIDVEGHEREAIAGMAGVLSNNFVLLQVEDYANEASDLPAVLGRFGLRFICRVGPDHYYSKAPEVGDSFTVRAFEEASERLVAEALAELREREGGGVRPIQINMGGSISVVLKGRVAKIARRLRHPLGTR